MLVHRREEVGGRLVGFGRRWQRLAVVLGLSVIGQSFNFGECAHLDSH